MIFNDEKLVVCPGLLPMSLVHDINDYLKEQIWCGLLKRILK